MKMPLNAELSLTIGMGRCLRRLLSEIEAAQGGDISPAFRKAHRRHKRGIIAVIRQAYKESGIGAVNDAESAAFIRALEYGEILEGEFFMVDSAGASELAPAKGNFNNVARRRSDEPPPPEKPEKNVAVHRSETEAPSVKQKPAIAAESPARKKQISPRCRPFPAAKPLNREENSSAPATSSAVPLVPSDEKSKEVMSQWR